MHHMHHMHRTHLLTSFLLVVIINATSAHAAPITFRANGLIDNINDTAAPPDFPPLLDALAVGTPWQLEVTFESTTPATPLAVDTFRYVNAIVDARLQLDTFVYTNSGGDIYTNFGLPAGAPGFGGPGLVQFHWTGGWSGGLGGPNLNAGLGLTIFSWNDLSAVDGSLPTTPAVSPDQGVLSGLYWSPFWGIPEISQDFTSADVNIELVDVSEVPEPSTMLMLGSGIAGLLAVRRSRGR
jgi:hypothetical protein